MDGLPIFTAGGTIVVGTIVKLDTTNNNTVVACGAGEVAFGVAQLGSRSAPIPDISTDPPQAATSGESLQVYTAGMYAHVRAGAAITAGDKVKSTNAAKGTPCVFGAGTREYYIGTALETVADGELCKILVLPGSVTTPA